MISAYHLFGKNLICENLICENLFYGVVLTGCNSILFHTQCFLLMV